MRAKIYWNLIWKSPGFVQFVPNLTPLHIQWFWWIYFIWFDENYLLTFLLYCVDFYWLESYSSHMMRECLNWFFSHDERMFEWTRCCVVVVADVFGVRNAKLIHPYQVNKFCFDTAKITDVNFITDLTFCLKGLIDWFNHQKLNLNHNLQCFYLKGFFICFSRHFKVNKFDFNLK